MIEKSPDKSSIVQTTILSFAAIAGAKVAAIASSENERRDDATLRRSRAFMRGRLSVSGRMVKWRETLAGGPLAGTLPKRGGCRIFGLSLQSRSCGATLLRVFPHA